MSLSTFNNHIDKFNDRTQKICDHVNKVFNLGLKTYPIKLKQPKFYNCFYNEYIKQSQLLIKSQFEKLDSELQSKHLIGPVQLVSTDWKDIDKALKKIETRINKY